MNRTTKLIILMLLSLSVYFIYQKTNKSIIKITNIGDSLSLGIDSYGIKKYSYIDYYKEYLSNKNYKVQLINKYSKKDLSIKEIKEQIKTNQEIKKDLSESHIIFITVGYNDLLYKLSLEENINQNKLTRIIDEIEKDYNEMIKEIRTYYKNDIYIIGYYKSNKEDYYINKGIRSLNNIIKNNVEVKYIDTYYLLNDQKYFSNPNSYYPNYKAYKEISKKIIAKTIEIT